MAQGLITKSDREKKVCQWQGEVEYLENVKAAGKISLR